MILPLTLPSFEVSKTEMKNNNTYIKKLIANCNEPDEDDDEFVIDFVDVIIEEGQEFQFPRRVEVEYKQNNLSIK